ncbi:hypothetical protein ACFQV2_32520 [Actinokineospora soli]|uniref:Uncharacterized protein n=1 Tax=Actinokineospora soli TaxID=1048753 RepID=A0ABW2TU93_9PSEU
MHAPLGRRGDAERAQPLAEPRAAAGGVDHEVRGDAGAVGEQHPADPLVVAAQADHAPAAGHHRGRDRPPHVPLHQRAVHRHQLVVGHGRARPAVDQHAAVPGGHRDSARGGQVGEQVGEPVVEQAAGQRVQDVELLGLRRAGPPARRLRRVVGLDDHHLVGAVGQGARRDQAREAAARDHRPPHPNRTGDSGLSAMSEPVTGASRRMRML